MSESSIAMMNRISSLCSIVSYRFIPPKNGGHRVNYDVCYFLNRCVPTTAISSYHNLKETTDFVLCEQFSDNKFKYINPLFSLRLWRWLRKNRPQSVILNQPFHAPLVLPVTKLLKIPCIIYEHNLEFKRFKTLKKWWWRGMFLFEKWSLKTVDGVFFISDIERQQAIEAFNLLPEKTMFLPHMVNEKESPTLELNLKDRIRATYNIASDTYLLLFYGAYSYSPNLEALINILDHILPRLAKTVNFDYHLLICGGGLTEELIDEKIMPSPNITYAGFVQDIKTVIQTADLVLNPVCTGGGVKTKAIEALAAGTPVLSSHSGAEGIVQMACGEQLTIVDDRCWQDYIAAIQLYQQRGKKTTPESFYKAYHWRFVTKRILDFINLRFNSLETLKK